MENQKKDTKSKVIIALLSLGLIGSLVYIYKLTTEVQKATTTITTITDEKSKVLNELSAIKASYDDAIAQNTTMSSELVAEREKVEKLIQEVKSSNGSIANLSVFKQKYNALESKMKTLLAEVDDLKKQNQTLVVQRDSTITVLGESKKYSEKLVGQNEELNKTIEKGSKLSVLNLRIVAYKMRSSGKQIETVKAGKTDVLKISFSIAENLIAKSGDKTYYIQVIDNNNNVIGEKQSVVFDGKNLTYSFMTTIKYENKTVNVTEDLQGKDFQKGNYYVNVFDKQDLVSSTSFTLE